MASIIANLPPPLLVNGGKPFSGNLQRTHFSLVTGRQNYTAGLFTAKATGESSESSTSLTVFKTVQNVWDRPEDRVGLIGLGFTAVVAFWASANLAVDKLPVIPGVLELIGIVFSSWFTYRFLLFKPDREELYRILNKSVSDILG